MNEDEERFNAALEGLVRLAIAANDDSVIPPRHRSLSNHPDPLCFAGMYHHLLPPNESCDVAQLAALLESCLAEAIQRLHVWHPPPRQGREASEYRVLISEWQEGIRSTLGARLPPCPAQEQFECAEDYEEARSRWASTVGRISALARAASTERE